MRENYNFTSKPRLKTLSRLIDLLLFLVSIFAANIYTIMFLAAAFGV